MITEEDKDEVKKLAKLYGVKLHFFENTGPYFGYWNRRDNSVNLNTISVHRNGQERSKSNFLGCFFHELGHTICYDKGLYYNYHNDNLLKKNKKNRSLIRRIALRAERFVDKIGAVEFKKKYPHLQYPYFYNNTEAIAVFRLNYLEKNYA